MWIIVVLVLITSRVLSKNAGKVPPKTKGKKSKGNTNLDDIDEEYPSPSHLIYLDGRLNEAPLMLNPAQTFFDILGKVSQNVKRVTSNYFQYQKENLKIQSKAVKISGVGKDPYIYFLRNLKFDGEIEKEEVFKDSSTNKKENKIFIVKTEKITSISGKTKVLNLTKPVEKSDEVEGESNRRLTEEEKKEQTTPKSADAQPKTDSVTTLPDYHPIKVVWDESLLHAAVLEIFPDDVDKKNQEKVLTQRKNLLTKVTTIIMKADSILRRYIFIKNAAPDKNSKSAKTAPTLDVNRIDCPSRDFFARVPKIDKIKLSVEADLLVILDMVNRKDKAIIAQAEPCTFNSKTNMAIVGRITLNFDKIGSDLNEKPDKINMVKASSQVITVLHETFHIIAFNTKLSVRFRVKKQIEPQLSYLSLLQRSEVPALIDKTFDHFSPGALPMDLMVPEERINSSITVFTLEYIDNISDNMVTSKEYLENNFVVNNDKDYERMLTYKCDNNDDRAAFPFYCTKKEMKNTPHGCDPSYVYKTICDEKGNQEYLKKPKAMGNYCYERKTVKNAGMCLDPHSANTLSKNSGSIEHFGADARCFESAETKPQKPSLCLKFKIEVNDIVVYHNDERYVCKSPTNGNSSQKANNKLVIGKSKIAVKCPDTEQFIKAYKMTKCNNLCHANGSCVDGKCICYDGFDPSTDCKEKLPNTGSGTMFISALAPTKGTKPKMMRMKEL